jgi:4'-phosphopantetheinyl transferase
MEEFLCPDPGIRLFLCRYDADGLPDLKLSGAIDVPAGITHPERIRQHQISRQMGKAILSAGLMFRDTGKPYSPGLAGVSISHTRGIVCLLTSAHSDCGVDIETVSEKAMRISPKFMNTEEKELTEGLFSAEQSSTLLWSFKEACYKFHGLGGLDFKKSIKLQEIDIYKKKLRGQLQLENSEMIWISGFFRFFEGRVLVYVIPEKS